MSLLLAPSPPAHLWVPPGRRGTYVDEVGEVADMLGRPLDPWGVTAADAVMSYGPGGRWHTLEAAVKMPRQVGKTKGIALPIALTVSTVFDPGPRLWTAHREKTYLETFELAKQLIEGSVEFSRRVARIREADGDKGIEFGNGSVLDFAVRSSQLGRGQEYPEHFIDEALYFKAGWAGALLPTMAAQPNPHVLYLSSGATSSEDSDYLRSLTKRGRSGSDPTLILVEHCAPGSWVEPGCRLGRRCDHHYGVEGCALDDERLWWAGIPSLGRRTSVEFIRSMRRAMEAIPIEFGREFLGWDEIPVHDRTSPITVEAWAERADRLGQISGPKVLFVDVAMDQRAASIGLGGRRGDGIPQVEIVKHGPGDDWVMDQMRAARAAGLWLVGLNGGKSPAAVLAGPLRALGFEVKVLSADDMATACGGLQRAIKNDEIRHLGDPIVTRALQVAARRPLGDAGGWAWSPKGSDGDVTALVAATGAHWLLLDRYPTAYDLANSFY